ncbi:DUF4279 domain-containing protein [Dyella marensis]|uniref:DUF4279 domain-containing protein n=1 Tax=Dyella marensis TaxID=500610 RepID=UPI0031DFC8C0
MPHTADRYTVELRISGMELSPSEITKAMDIQPTHVRSKGERRGASSTFESGVWSYAGTHADEWSSLEAGLVSLMEILRPKKALIASYAERFDVCWWCGHFQQSFDGGPTLSPALLGDLADFGVAVVLSNYHVGAER